MATTTRLPSASRPEALPAWLAIIAATALVAILGGMVSGGEADPWYKSLSKAPGNPPGFIFGVVWPILYTTMALGACLVWRSAGSWRAADEPLGIYFVQLIANLGWSVLFFHFHATVAALIDIACLWVLVLLMMSSFAKHSSVAAQLQLPYLAWLTFAAYLNAWVVFAN